MKKLQYYVILAVVFAAWVYSSTKVHGDPKQLAPRQAVILQGFNIYKPLDGGAYQYTGIGVWCSSSSLGAPSFPPPVIGSTNTTDPASMADALAQLLSQGYKIEHIDGMNYTLVK